jgi:hypothetical protein
MPPARRLAAALLAASTLAPAISMAVEQPFFRYPGSEATRAPGPLPSDTSPAGPSDPVPALAIEGVSPSYLGAAGSDLATDMPAVPGATGTVRYTIAPSPPAWLTFHEADGNLTGRPQSSSDTVRYTITVTEQPSGRQGTATFDLAVQPAPAFSVQPTAAPAMVGNAVSVAPALAFARNGASFSLLQGGVPAPNALAGCSGLSFSSADGTITGTQPVPCGPVPNLSIEARDGTGNTVRSDTFTVSIGPDLKATSAQAAYSGRDGTRQTSLPVQIEGGSGSTSYALVTVSGTAPADATVSQANGSVSYTPGTANDGWSYLVRATDRTYGGHADTPAVTVSVAPPFLVSYPTRTVHDFTGNVKPTPVVSGAIGPVSYTRVSFTSASIATTEADPSTGLVSISAMKPNRVGSYVVRATDSDGATQTVTGTVNTIDAASVSNLPSTLTVRQGATFTGPRPTFSNPLGKIGYSSYRVDTWDEGLTRSPSVPNLPP